MFPDPQMAMVSPHPVRHCTTMHFKMGWSSGGDASQYGNEKEDGEGEGENQHADPKRLCSKGRMVLEDRPSRRVFIPLDFMKNSSVRNERTRFVWIIGPRNIVSCFPALELYLICRASCARGIFLDWILHQDHRSSERTSP